MSIWFSEHKLQEINNHCKGTMVSFLEIEFTDISSDTLKAVMPVSDNIKQPFGIVHGGANCVLAESLGSLAANLCLDPKKQHAVGLSINTNHIKAVRNGHITGVASAIHIGKKTHIWKIDTFNSNSDLSSQTQLTMAIIDKK